MNAPVERTPLETVGDGIEEAEVTLLQVKAVAGQLAENTKDENAQLAWAIYSLAEVVGLRLTEASRALETAQAELAPA